MEMDAVDDEDGPESALTGCATDHLQCAMEELFEQQRQSAR